MLVCLCMLKIVVWNARFREKVNADRVGQFIENITVLLNGPIIAPAF